MLCKHIFNSKNHTWSAIIIMLHDNTNLEFMDSVGGKHVVATTSYMIVCGKETHSNMLEVSISSFVHPVT